MEVPQRLWRRLAFVGRVSGRHPTAGSDPYASPIAGSDPHAAPLRKNLFLSYLSRRVLVMVLAMAMVRVAVAFEKEHRIDWTWR